jgi:hypothetical protein
MGQEAATGGDASQTDHENEIGACADNHPESRDGLAPLADTEERGGAAENSKTPEALKEPEQLEDRPRPVQVGCSRRLEAPHAQVKVRRAKTEKESRAR